MRNPYDLIAEQFFNSRQSFFREKKYLEMVLAALKPQAHILDLGCGTGRPIAEYLIAHGFQVTGVDRSQQMLEIAQTLIPTARLIHAAMESVDFSETFDAALVWDSLFHVERRHHRAIYAKLRRWLVTGGMLLLSSGGTGHAALHGSMHGHEFFYSSYAPAEVIQFLQEAGFRVVFWEVDEPAPEGHIAIVAQATEILHC